MKTNPWPFCGLIRRFVQNSRLLASIAVLVFGYSATTGAEAVFVGERKLNNLVSELLEVSSPIKPGASFTFTRPGDGWILVALSSQGKGTARVILDKGSRADNLMIQAAESRPPVEAMRYVSKGDHTIELECQEDIRVEKLVVKAIPELMHCGLGFNPEIKSYGVYDLEFLKRDVLPNVTTLIVPHNITIAASQVEDWHRQGKRFVAEVGINSQGKTAEDHAKYWTSFYEKAPFLEGIIINEFIVNRPVVEWATLTPERLARMERERQEYEVYAQAIKRIRADERFKDKLLYAYVGGSGKKLNQEIIGTNFMRAIIDCGYRVALERYLHEMSSEQGSKDALQTFVDGIADWEAKAPGVRKQMVVTFGLFSMPPGGINKQPNVDYHVWMDRQMNLAANHPTLTGICGLSWWTSTLADEETVRFVGKLYRHYAIEGKTGMLTKDPLFLTHIQNADFEKGTEGLDLASGASGQHRRQKLPPLWPDRGTLHGAWPAGRSRAYR